MTRVTVLAYGLYALAVFALVSLGALTIAVVVPWQQTRERWMAGATRLAFVLALMRPKVSGFDNLPAGDSVVVANHASYIDGLLLKGFLPARFSFVIKGEYRKVPVLHFLLRRAGARFVERYAIKESTRDARKIVQAAKQGQSLAFFPEGTFAPEPGLFRFRKGAFVAAIKGEMPVVPIAILGTRAMLPDGRLLPRPGPLEVRILPAIGPDDPRWRDNLALAEAARNAILKEIDEPDRVAREAA